MSDLHVLGDFARLRRAERPLDPMAPAVNGDPLHVASTVVSDAHELRQAIVVGMKIIRTLNRSIRLHVAFDGTEALAFLKRTGFHADAYQPDLILLDLNLPKMDGREFLARVKEDASLKHIPIIILTTSNSEVDVLECYGLGASCYLKKTAQLGEFEVIVKCINDFWFPSAIAMAQF